MAFLEIKNLNFSYKNSEAKILNNINLNINKGDFLLLYGLSGCGKTTLLRNLKPIIAPVGNKSGDILLNGKAIDSIDTDYLVSKVGFVFQDPDSQIVTDKVWHELSFPLESLGYKQDAMRLKVAETASFFGIHNYFYRNTDELSGGQKQLLSLASAMITDPEILILDEPTAQLDPIASQEFLNCLKKINEELGTTIILSEHRLENLFPMVDKVAIMENGQIIISTQPRNIGKELFYRSSELLNCMPLPVFLHSKYKTSLPCPLSVKETKIFLEKLLNNKALKHINHHTADNDSKPLIELKKVWFRYQKNSPDIIKDLSMKVKKGEFYCIVGSNGVGKTTALKILSGILKPYRGKIKLPKDIITTYIPQDVNLCFSKTSVKEELYENNQSQGETEAIIQSFKLEKILNAHPYDISQGEKQKLALAKAILRKAQILFLDEPTKAIDPICKKEISKIFKKLLNGGTTIIMISHDLEFCSENASKCALFFDGNIITENNPTLFFSNNNFYTTISNRVSKHLADTIVSKDQLLDFINKNLEVTNEN